MPGEHELRIALATALRERDEARALSDRLETAARAYIEGHERAMYRAETAEQERDALRADVQRLRAALTTIRDEMNKPWLMGSEVNRVAVDCANAALEAEAALAAPAAGEEGTHG